jgi:hypothetical protein
MLDIDRNADSPPLGGQTALEELPHGFRRQVHLGAMLSYDF